MRLPLLPVGAIIFVSGFCSLVYQSVWLREFRLIFGASTLANSAVLAIFMAGLGIGGLVLGHYADRWRRPFNNYAYIEFAIALLVGISPLLLDWVRSFYLSLGGSSVLGNTSATLLRLGLATLVIFPSVFVMGGTLPAAARAVTGRDDLSRHGLALLYAVNTLGAVLGVALSTFYLFELNGFRTTLWLACLLNVLIALCARVLARRYEQDTLTDNYDTPSQSTTSAATTNVWLLPAAFVTGFVFFLAELVWYRLAAPILGGSTYTFGVILAIALLGIGLGGYLHALRSEAQRATVAEFGVTCTLQALLLVLPYAMGDKLALLAFHLHNFGESSFAMLSWGWVLVALVMVLPAALVAGYQFPLMFALKGQGAEGVASDTGQIYAANTFGSILGALVGGFILIPNLGANNSWVLAAALLLVLGVVLIAATLRRAPVSAVVSSLFTLTAIGLVITNPGPTSLWKHTAIGAGRANLFSNSQNMLKSHVVSANNNVLESYDGIESNLGFSTNNALSIIVNGKSDGNVIGDAITQIFLGLVPAAIHGNPESAFVIGLGTGETAGWLAEVESIEHVEVAEIEPKVVRFTELAAAANVDVAQHPKVTIHIGDGRELLITSNEQFDLILSEPSNPYRAGIASFYSQEFYQLAAQRLTPGGYFAQWVQSYEITPLAVQTVARTMASVFPYISYWTLTSGDLLLVGSFHEQVYDAARIAQLSQQHPFATALDEVTQTRGAEGLLMMHLAQPDITPLLTKNVNEINRDDDPVLEYMFARSVGKPFSTFQLKADILELARDYALALPQLEGGSTIDWQQVEYYRARSIFGLPDVALTDTPANEDIKAFWRSYSNEDFDAAYERLQDVRDVLLQDDYGKLAVAETEVLYHAVNATSELDAQREALASTNNASYPEELLALQLYAALKAEDEDDIAALLPRYVTQARANPWILTSAQVRPLVEVRNSQLSEELTGQWIEALLQPFSVYKLNASRRETLLQLARRQYQDKPHPRCAEVYTHLHDAFPWQDAALAARLRCYSSYDHPGRAEAEQAYLTYRGSISSSLRQQVTQ